MPLISAPDVNVPSFFLYLGAGKTYTVSGPSTGDHDSRGLCSRTIDYLFAAAHRLAGSAISIKFSAIEIYNDVATDLLRSQDTKNSTKLLIMDSPGGILVPDLLLFPLSSSAEGQHKLYEANINRYIAFHARLIILTWHDRVDLWPSTSSIDSQVDRMRYIRSI